MPNCCANGAIGSPDKFINVAERTTRTGVSATFNGAAVREWPATGCKSSPDSASKSSTAMYPTLWRVAAYLAPGFAYHEPFGVEVCSFESRH